ncbi:glycoside hydrolase family 113 [Arthrobacter psychrochitiniphilus]|uniref:glycoside hydrolase family 113 n=1 Tax=Arthrobacter psychrochitiniphilus TaxID=291045 RepID=UPI003F7C97BB
MSAASELLAGRVSGMTWGWVGTRGTWDTDEAHESMKAMTEHSVTWTALAYAAEQATAFSTEISFDTAPTVQDGEIVAAIRQAHSLGLKVCLKPVVNVADGTWRANIGFFDWDVPGEPSWTQWFAEYERFIVHAASIAEAENCAMFCIGCEMVRADGQETHWRNLIAAVRNVYTGVITYNCDKYQEDHVSWWDAVDVISSSGYYPIDALEEQLERVGEVVRRHGKPFFFMEAGCPSREGSAQLPNDWNLVGEPSGAEQLRYFEALFAACEERDWIRGLMLWDWPAALYPAVDAGGNDDYCPYGKPAGTFMAERYAAWNIQ